MCHAFQNSDSTVAKPAINDWCERSMLEAVQLVTEIRMWHNKVKINTGLNSPSGQ